MADLKQLAETLVNLTVKEVNELAAILKDEYGIEPAAAAVVAVRVVVVAVAMVVQVILWPLLPPMPPISPSAI